MTAQALVVTPERIILFSDSALTENGKVTLGTTKIASSFDKRVILAVHGDVGSGGNGSDWLTQLAAACATPLPDATFETIVRTAVADFRGTLDVASNRVYRGGIRMFTDELMPFYRKASSFDTAVNQASECILQQIAENYGIQSHLPAYWVDAETARVLNDVVFLGAINSRFSQLKLPWLGKTSPSLSTIVSTIVKMGTSTSRLPFDTDFIVLRRPTKKEDGQCEVVHVCWRGKRSNLDIAFSQSQVLRVTDGEAMVLLLAQAERLPSEGVELAKRFADIIHAKYDSYPRLAAPIMSSGVKARLTEIGMTDAVWEHVATRFDHNNPMLDIPCQTLRIKASADDAVKVGRTLVELAGILALASEDDAYVGGEIVDLSLEDVPLPEEGISN